MQELRVLSELMPAAGVVTPTSGSVLKLRRIGEGLLRSELLELRVPLGFLRIATQELRVLSGA
eukprot:1140338-Alexandrium_andersonii.AAC.1